MATPVNVRASMTRATERLEDLPPVQARAVGATRLFEAVNGLEPWTEAEPWSSESAGGATAIRWATGYDSKRGLLTRLRTLRNDTIGVTGRSAPITVDPATGQPDAPRQVQTQQQHDATMARLHDPATGFLEGITSGLDRIEKVAIVVAGVAALALVVVLVLKLKR